jgi:hypothetical protein
MKKTLLFVVILTASLSSVFAQKARIGFSAGISLSNMDIKVDNESTSGTSKVGLQAGIVLDAPIGSHFAFQPELNFVQKGTKDHDATSNIDSKLNVNYLELPLHIVYKTNQSPNHFFVGAGPTLAYAISGKASITSNGGTSSSDLKFGSSDTDDMKPFDFGVGFVAGFEVKSGIRFSANYTLGLSNLAPGSNNNGTLKNRAFGFTLGYMLHSH